MSEHFLSVRELQEADIERITQYWLSAEASFLQGMGVDLSKIPNREGWKSMLQEQLSQNFQEKKSYCIVWLVNNRPIGHSNVNKIIFGKEAFMHLHIWEPEWRKKGYGTSFVKMSLPYFFENLQLEKLYCEPFALNPAPHLTLRKIGFEFVKEYTTIPGWINFEQPVKLWKLDRTSLKKMR